MMDKHAFFNLCLETVKNRFGSEEYEIRVEEFNKNNQIWKGIVISKRSASEFSGGPVVYPELYLEKFPNLLGDEEELRLFLDNLCNEVENSISGIDLGQIVKQHLQPECLRLAVTDYEKNKDWLAEGPHRRMADLAIYAFSTIKIDDDRYTFRRVTNDMLENLRLTEEELFAIADVNTKCGKTFEALSTLMPPMFLQETMETPGLYMLTTSDSRYGAALIACKNVLKEIHNQLKTNFFILPSSIHEVLVLPVCNNLNASDSAQLKHMVGEVNRTVVDPSDVLTDSVYYFDGETFTTL